MADEQKFMADLYETIIEGTDLYNSDSPYSDLQSSDPTKIYECIDGKVDTVLDFVVEYFVGEDKQISINDIRQLKTLIQSDTWEDACLSIAKHVNETRLDGIYDELLKKLESVVDLYHYVNDINDIVNELHSPDETTSRQALVKLGDMFLSFGQKLSEKLPTLVGDIVGFQFSVGKKLLNDGAAIIEKHINEIKTIEDEIENILNGSQKKFDFSRLESVKNGLDVEAQIAEIKEIISIHEELKQVYRIVAPNKVSEITGIINQLNGKIKELRNYHNDFEALVDLVEQSRHRDIFNNLTDKMDEDKLRDKFNDWQNDMNNKYDGKPPYIDPDKNAGGMEEAANNTNGAKKATVDPLILDIGNDGFDVETKKLGTYFDMNCDGFAERINWTSKDAILALDKNGNGLIDDGSEVFGDYHLLADGSRAKNGFEALAQYDTNGDGVIDENDEIFDQLRLWVDENGDGVSDAGELKSLRDMNIKAINLNYDYVNQSTETEAIIGNAATFVYNDGSVGNIGEMWVSADLYDALEKITVDVTDMIDGLPNVRSYGKVNSLHTAVVLDETGKLRALVENFVTEM